MPMVILLGVFLFDDDACPSVSVGLSSILYSTEEVEESLADGTWLFAEDIALASLYVVDA